MSYSRDHAIVIGGGIAGLLAARVLADEFKHVSLIERDHYPAEPVFRAGAPQGRHVHILLMRGQRILEELLPGITTKLKTNGAVPCDFLRDMHAHYPAGWITRSASDLQGYTTSRLLIEWQIRQELLKCEGIQFVEGQEVVELLANTDKQTVTGVRMRARNGAAPAESEMSELSADFVVDASGRESHAPQWLEALGYPPPAVTVLNAFFGYATRVYTPGAQTERDWRVLVVMPQPPKQLRAGVIWPVEEGKWWIMLAGSGKDYPPTDEEGFLAFAQSLPVPDVYEMLKDARAEGPIHGYRRTENQRRHFEKQQRLPDGFIALGDSACAFNPIYGQGMTVAAMEAVLLRDMLRQSSGKDLVGFAPRFYKRLAKLVDLPWLMSSAGDYRVPGAEGEQISWSLNMLNNYFDGITDLVPFSPLVYKAFLEAIHMTKPPTKLFRPAILLQVLTRGWRKKRA